MFYCNSQYQRSYSETDFSEIEKCATLPYSGHPRLQIQSDQSQNPHVLSLYKDRTAVEWHGRQVHHNPSLMISLASGIESDGMMRTSCMGAQSARRSDPGSGIVREMMIGPF